MKVRGYLFDIYTVDERVHLWLIDEKGCLNHFEDVYHPQIYLSGDDNLIRKFYQRLLALHAVAKPPLKVQKREFYTNQEKSVWQITISRPSVLSKIKHKLFVFYDRLDVYHSDVSLVTAYLAHRKLIPLGYMEVSSQISKFCNRIIELHSLDNIKNYNYTRPRFKIMYMNLKKSHRLQISISNPLIFSYEGTEYEISCAAEKEILNQINFLLLRIDPDIIISQYGDQFILPQLYAMAARHKFKLNFDRTVEPIIRNIRQKGKSFMTYGSWIFRAGSYPFYGRWHIDAKNSFLFKETQLLGIVEMARVSGMAPQEVARASTGNALTNMETLVAIEKNYLVPWQKSKIEDPKSWYQLHLIDKGGLVFAPKLNSSFQNINLNSFVYENVAQIDFSQMYPTIMDIHNISPETINCVCCDSSETFDYVPEANYRICRKRRGVVSDTLADVLQRRAHYKKIKNTLTGIEKEENQVKIDSLKWINVVSFGYLGFRNAKFGKLESHESVTAFGRNKLLKAMRICEFLNFEVLHAITDCLFIYNSGISIEQYQFEALAAKIKRFTKIEISLEGFFSWIIFLPSRQNDQQAVANRYLGRFSNGELKFRGINARRKDMPDFIIQSQLDWLNLMKNCSSVKELRELHPVMLMDFQKKMNLLLNANLPLTSLLLRKTVSRELNEYEVENATALSLAQLDDIEIAVQPGEKVRYLVMDQKNPNKAIRYLAEEKIYQLAAEKVKFDLDFYFNLLWQSFEEIWQYFSPDDFFRHRPQIKQSHLFCNVV